MENNISENNKIQVGQRVHSSSRFSSGTGIIYEIIGEQKGGGFERKAGLISLNGQAKFKIVFETYFTEIYESSLHLDTYQWEILDTVATTEEIATAIRIAENAIAEAKTEEEKKAKARADKIAANVEANPHLKTREDFPQISSYALAAKNMRIELKKAFPGQKFSVRSEGYSMGSSVNVKWTDGPTLEQVSAIIDKYQYGHFNGMEDIYEIDSENTWPRVFGDAKHVFGYRKYSEEIRAKAKEKFDHYDIDECYKSRKRGDWLSEQDLYIKPEPKAAKKAKHKAVSKKKGESLSESRPTESTPVKTDFARIEYNEEFNGIEIYFPGKPDTGTRDELKCAGYRWHRIKKCWYAKHTENTETIALNIAGEPEPATDEPQAPEKENVQTHIKKDETQDQDRDQGQKKNIQASPTPSEKEEPAQIIPFPQSRENQKPNPFIDPEIIQDIPDHTPEPVIIPELVDELPEDVRAIN